MEWPAHPPLVGGGGVSIWYQSRLYIITEDLSKDDTTQRLAHYFPF